MRAIALAVLMIVGCDKGTPAQTREELAAKQARAEADRQAEEAKQVAELQKQLDALNDKVVAAVNAVVESTNDDDRSAARARLDELRRQQVELKQRLVIANAKRTHVNPNAKISQECLDNPLGSGCL